MNVLEQLAESFREMVKKKPDSSYFAAGKQVVCGHCGSETFKSQRVLVRGPLSYCLVYTKYSLAMWFETAPGNRDELAAKSSW